jgi:hypothetical protein
MGFSLTGASGGGGDGGHQAMSNGAITRNSGIASGSSYGWSECSFTIDENSPHINCGRPRGGVAAKFVLAKTGRCHYETGF